MVCKWFILEDMLRASHGWMGGIQDVCGYNYDVGFGDGMVVSSGKRKGTLRKWVEE